MFRYWPEADTYGVRTISFSRRVVKLRILPRRAGFYIFGMGIVPHKKPKETPGVYIAAELQEICKTWDLLLDYFKEFLSVTVQCYILLSLSTFSPQLRRG